MSPNTRIKPFLSFARRMARSRLTGASYPFLVQLNVTNRCNYRCAYCYGHYFERSKDEMDLPQILSVIDALAQRGTYRVNFVGGEPLLREDLAEIIRHAKSRGLVTAMTTNGSLVPKRLDVVRELDSVCFSLDGSAEPNDLGRGKGSFQRVQEGLKACHSVNVPVQLSAVLTRHTLDQVDFLAALAAEHHCQVGFTPLISQDREDKTTSHSLFPDSAALAQALDHICHLKRQGAPILFSERAYSYCRDWPAPGQDVLPAGKPGFTPIPCKAGAFFCLVDYNANLYPCPQLVGRFKAKNVLQDGLDASLAHAAAHGCQACSMPCSNEFSLFFGLSPSVLWEQLHSRWRSLWA
ncbi:MAG: radical SAM protein [Humidesulfovibrio sp.]|nr:radical SAM protein [Humidesulfovibrio sp.]